MKRCLNLTSKIVLVVAGLIATSLCPAGVASATAPSSSASPAACSQPTTPEAAVCNALVRTVVTKSELPVRGFETPGDATSEDVGSVGNNGAYSPAYLQSAYNVASLASDGKAGAGQIVGIVDPFADPNLASDLAYYRAYFGLSSCPSGTVSTTATTCTLEQANEFGAPTPLPAPNANWAVEVSLDVEMVSAICPNCQILVVEANSASLSDLGTAVNTAVSLGATVVSNSYGVAEFPTEDAYSNAYFNHPGVAIVAAAGDAGYGVEFPAASPDVVAVGGTTLYQSTDNGARNATETVWSGSGAGCSAYEPKPAWQHDTGCSNRQVADISAIANPSTGVWVYNSYGTGNTASLSIVGGTSVATPVISALFALAGVSQSTTPYPAANLYNNSSWLYQVTTGNDAACGTYLCDAALSLNGYNGPAGLGTPGAFPNSLTALTGRSLPAAPVSNVAPTSPVATTPKATSKISKVSTTKATSKNSKVSTAKATSKVSKASTK